MSDRPAAYDNLVKSGSLKDSERLQVSIDQYMSVATGMLADARITGLSTHGRYILAYEGIFSVVMATMENFGARPGGGDGHRVIAIQRAAADLGLDPSRFSSLTMLHSERNRSTYREPIPPITEEQVDLAVRLLTEMLEKARPLVTVQEKRGQTTISR